MYKKNLSIQQRIFVVIIYILTFISICRFFSGNWSFLWNSNDIYNLPFISGALLLIFGTYVAEPHFTKPADVIINSFAIILALFSVKNSDIFIGYCYLLIAASVLGISAIVLIFLSEFLKFKKATHVFYEIITKLGQSKIAFSSIYLLTIFSYHKKYEPIGFTFLLTFWIIFITRFLVENFVLWISKILYLIKSKDDSEILGEAIGCENPFLYKIEIDFLKHKAKETKKGKLVYLSLIEAKGVIGIIINEKQLLNKKWITVYLLEEDNIPLKIDFKKNALFNESNTIFSKDNAVYSLNFDDIKSSDAKKLIGENYLYKNRNNFIGYIAKGSDIHKIKFHSLLDSSNEENKSIKEGTIIKTKINNDDVLYQIIDGKTFEEKLEQHNTYGYLEGIAQKLGQYNQKDQKLEVVKWLPNIYAPVFFDKTELSTTNELVIGKLPGTNLEIVLHDIDSLITHNTAILGILGIGKSRLSFELIQKIITTKNIKIICIDITNEYDENLKKYGCSPNKIDDGDLIKKLNNHYTEINKDIHKGGNHVCFKEFLIQIFEKFIDDQSDKVLIINPEDYEISKQTRDVKPKKVGPGRDDWEDQAPMNDLTLTEKTRIITETVLEIFKKKGISKAARCLIVFEEAHSLVPEWNSASNEGDKNASNGIAKVILQGRKYGLGSFAITQRTANISKSILNQCNTVFALRTFDDTGKGFLENYIGSDYSNTLPSLDDRHAVVFGKALKLKQPVIIKLNDENEIIKKKNKHLKP